MFRPNCILAAGLALAGVARSEPVVVPGGVPLVGGVVWSGGGIGAAVAMGPSWSGDHAPLTHFNALAWHHYRPWLLGGLDIDLGSVRPKEKSQQFVSRYDLLLSAVTPMGRSMAWENGMRLGWTSQQFYADTGRAGDPAVLRTARGVMMGGHIALGGRGPGGQGGWLGLGSRSTWWKGQNGMGGLEWVLEAEPGWAVSLHRWWPSADSLTRGYDFQLRFPVTWVVRGVDLSGLGRGYQPSPLKYGIRTGMGVAF